MLKHMDADEAQLLLSLIGWPRECPDPRVVADAVRGLVKEGNEERPKVEKPTLNRVRGERGRFVAKAA
jgi:hypothetical protein